jgi:antitoxin component YwqK of YwqJK toxin-antitoxin module
MRDTIWAFAYDTTVLYDTTWVYAHDTTVIRDSIWLFAVDSVKSFDTLVVSNNDTVTIHTYSSKFPNNFTPDMIRENQSAFPKYKTLGDALRARDTGDKSAQGWINQALNSAGGDWVKAETEYKKLQEMYSTAMVQAITREPKDNDFIGPDLKYRSVVFDTLKILTFDTTLVQDTIKNLVKQTYVKYDTSVVNKRREVIANTTPPGHELIIKYHRNGRVKERGLMKGSKKNGEWMQYDFKGLPLRKSLYDMGRMTEDELIVTSDQENSNPMSDDSKSVKKDKKKDKSKSKKANSIFKLPSFRKN